jgi:hypothetical protein
MADGNGVSTLEADITYIKAKVTKLEEMLESLYELQNDNQQELLETIQDSVERGDGFQVTTFES